VLAFAAALLASAVNADDAVPVTTAPWQEAVVSVSDLDRSARFFMEIGGYDTKWRGAMHPTELAAWGLPAGAIGEVLVIGATGQDGGLVRLVRFDDAGRKVPTRPGARAWDTGCYFSLMVRMKDMPVIYDDAIALGWWTETPMAYLEFGASRLNIMVFRGPDGVQVQGYERLSPPLPDAIPAFDRMTAPFNIMQMVRDRDAAYAFFRDVLGFDTFFLGEPTTSPTPEINPLGIPLSLTPTVPYRAGIVFPVPGEFGRMEMIEIMGIDGQDYADRCNAPNLGILAVRFQVRDVDEAKAMLEERDWPIHSPVVDATVQPYGPLQLFAVKTPDGANIQFYAPAPDAD
jgi:catechol 2,3-dioxygenase-like lactoylglutathione lyase family enzyme